MRLRTASGPQRLHRRLAENGASRHRQGFDQEGLLGLQQTLGNRAVAQLLGGGSVLGGGLHAPQSVRRASIVQRCGPVACNCSAEKQAAYAAKAMPPQCGVSSPDEMGSDAVSQVANASDEEVAEKAARPRAGSATIVCDGKGGYRVALNDWAGAPCRTESCVTKHEQQHIADWKKRWPNGCKPKEDHADGSDIPLGGDGYDDFLKDSECKAHTVDLKCADTLLKSAAGDCKAKVKSYRDLTAEQKANYC